MIENVVNLIFKIFKSSKLNALTRSKIGCVHFKILEKFWEFSAFKFENFKIEGMEMLLI